MDHHWYRSAGEWHQQQICKEASVMMENGRVTSGIDGTGPEEKVVLRVSKARCWRLVQAHG